MSQPWVTALLPLVAAIGLAGGALLPHGVGAQSAAAATARPQMARDRSDADNLLGGFAFAPDRGPVTISAKELEFDYRGRVLTYRGAVSVTQADLTLHSDLLRVTFEPDAPDRLREVVAEGAVRIAKGDRLATGGRAVFDQAARTVTLTDQATLRDGPNEVVGERVVVYLDEARGVVEGGEDRVRAVLFPPEEGKAGGPAGKDDGE